jgi:hypothetical protein
MKLIERFLYFIIWLTEKWLYRKYKFDENDNTKKIIKSNILDGYEILTDTGFQKISHVHKTQPYTIYEIEFINGKKLKCADNHIVYKNGFECFVKNLKKGDFINSKHGNLQITKIQKTNYKVCLYDVTVADENHRYYANDILSHNTVISSIFITWYLLFNFDRNVLLLANKGATAKEIIDKCKSIMENLPFFLKPGIKKKDVYSMKFDNDCRLIGSATTKTAAIGFTVHLLYSDEFAHIPANILNTLWRSVYPTLSSSAISKVIITSTPNGMNLFYELYNGSVNKLNTFKNLFVAWWQVKGRDEAWRLKEIQNMGSLEAFNQEYGCQFITSGNMLLDGEGLQKLNAWKKDYEVKQIPELDALNVNYGDLRFAVDFDIDNIKDADSFFLFSIDTGEGLQQDFSEIHIFKFDVMPFNEAKTHKSATNVTDFVILNQVGNFSTNSLTPDLFSNFLYDLCVEVFNMENLLISIELNSAGGEVVRNTYNLYGEDNEFDGSCYVKYPKSEKSKRKEDGIYISGHNKKDLCVNLKKMIRDNRIILTDVESLKQFNSFAKDKNGSFKAMSGHDDKVMTSVIAASAINTASFAEMSEDYLDTIPTELLKMYEDILDEKLTKREKKHLDYDDFF